MEESQYYVKLLRELDVDQFVRETIETKKIAVKKLLTAFSARVPTFLEGQPDVGAATLFCSKDLMLSDQYAYLPLLGLAMQRELEKRAKLPQYNTVDDAVTLLKKSKNIIVLTGAGV